MKHYKLVIKAVIFIAAFLYFTISNAQEYNNWLLIDGGILNFNTSPATLICQHDENIWKNTIALSDDNGELLIYGYTTKVESENGYNRTDYIIKNSRNDTLVDISDIRIKNVIAAKSIEGYYYIAIAHREKKWKYSHLRIYKFDKNANLVDSLISDYESGDFAFFVTFVQKRNGSLKLLAYNRSKQAMEIYKLDGEIMTKTHEHSISLERIEEADFLLVTCCINLSLNTKRIIISTIVSRICYILDYDYNTDKISILKSFDTKYSSVAAFSENDKYFLIIDDNILKGFDFNGTFDFDIEKPDVWYKLPEETTDNKLWDMRLGNDGKIYIHNTSSDCIVILDGIETGNITSEIIQSDCIKHCHNLFPQIPRIQKTKSAPCPEIEKPKIICE